MSDSNSRPFVIRFPHQIDQALYLIRERRFREIGKRVVSRLYEEWLSYGLRRDLSIAFEAPKARIPISIRAFREADIPYLFPSDTSGLLREEQLEIAARRAHLSENISTCYVAIDLRNNIPCYAQWLMGPEQNEKIQRFFNGRFPRLSSDEALLENAYTPLEYRGKGIMPTAMALIAERAIEMGCRYVFTFVARDNVPSLKGCTKAGFSPYLIRHDSRLLFHLLKRRRFSRLPESFVFPHEVKKAPRNTVTKQSVSPELA